MFFHISLRILNKIKFTIMKKLLFVFSVVIALFFTACDPNAVNDFLNNSEQGDSIQLPGFDGDSIPYFPGFDGDSIPYFPGFDGDSIPYFPGLDGDSIQFPEFDNDSITDFPVDSIPYIPGFDNDSIA